MQGDTAAGTHPQLHRRRYLPQMDMPRHDLAEAVNDAHERPIHLGAAHAHGVQQRTVACPLDTFLYRITAHYPHQHTLIIKKTAPVGTDFSFKSHPRPVSHNLT